MVIHRSTIDGWGHRDSDRLSLVYTICFNYGLYVWSQYSSGSWYSVDCDKNMCFSHQTLLQPRWEHFVRRPWSPAQRRLRNLLQSWCRCSDNTAWGSPWIARQREITFTVKAVTRAYTRGNTDFLPCTVSCTDMLCDEQKLKWNRMCQTIYTYQSIYLYCYFSLCWQIYSIQCIQWYHRHSFNFINGFHYYQFIHILVYTFLTYL